MGFFDSISMNFFDSVVVASLHEENPVILGNNHYILQTNLSSTWLYHSYPHAEPLLSDIHPFKLLYAVVRLIGVIYFFIFKV